MNDRDEWVHRVCVGCGATYEFVHAQVTATGVGGSIMVLEALVNGTTNSFMNEPPCPACGCRRPAVISRWKRARHLFLAIGLLPVSVVVFLFGWGPGITGATYATTAIILAVVSAIALFAHALVALADLNRNREANRAAAEELIDRRRMEVVADQNPDRAIGEPRVVARNAVPLLAVGAVGLLLMLPPFLLRWTGDWPIAAGTKPEVVCPGDTVRVWLPDRIDAVKGHWRGNPRATVTAADPSRPVAVAATAQRESWGDTISGKNLSSTQPNLWADVTLPDDPALAGRTVEVRVDMTVEYPFAFGAGFENRTAEAGVTRSYTLAAKGESAKYTVSYWLAGVGVLLMTACGFGLWWASKGLLVIPRPR